MFLGQVKNNKKEQKKQPQRTKKLKQNKTNNNNNKTRNKNNSNINKKPTKEHALLKTTLKHDAEECSGKKGSPWTRVHLPWNRKGKVSDGWSSSHQVRLSSRIPLHHLG